MTNILGHWGDADQNHSEILPHAREGGRYQKKKKKRQKIASADKGVEQWKPLCTLGSMVK